MWPIFTWVKFFIGNNHRTQNTIRANRSSLITPLEAGLRPFLVNLFSPYVHVEILSFISFIRELRINIQAIILDMTIFIKSRIILRHYFLFDDVGEVHHEEMQGAISTKIFIVSAVRPSSVTDNLRGRYIISGHGMWKWSISYSLEWKY